MSKNVKFELNLAGLNELMKSSAMQSQLSACCHRVQNAAGSGFSSRVGIGSYTAIGNVYADNKESAHKAYQENTLVKALGSAGLGM